MTGEPNQQMLQYGIAARDLRRSPEHMHYIHCKNDDSIMFGRYREALATYRDRLPKRVAQFAGDEERFALDHPKSLHDAGLERATVTETPGRTRVPSSVAVELLLIGQQGDRHIRLSYRDVARFRISGKKAHFGWRYSFLGDIFTHEVRVGDTGRVVHEILFGSGSTIVIECANF